jgi:hypothetical protein
MHRSLTKADHFFETRPLPVPDPNHFLVGQKQPRAKRSKPKEKEAIRKTATGIPIKPEKRFFRLDRPFNDAVRFQEKSAVVEVLLRIPISGDKASRTAKKVLAFKS